ncbi:MAG: protein phosphatase 2C domain-containing protein [Treponema sp.]|nr:protein phosphatase 2C domain-containing protein [Treponema sp.]
MHKSFAVTVTGISHTKKGLVCQDDSAFYEDKDVSITVVADGHGDSSCFRSDLGSKFAVKCTLDGIKDFVKAQKKLFKDGKLPTEEEFNEILRKQLITAIVKSWNMEVSGHYEKNLFTEEDFESVESEKYRNRYREAQQIFTEQKSSGSGLLTNINEASVPSISKAYGATLIAAAITPDYWFGFHIGDGRFTVLYKDGKSEQPVPWDEKCYLNVTTSICDDDILERPHGVRSYFSLNAKKEAPVAIYICTDGIDDNYPADEKENKVQLTRLYRTISLAYADDGFENTNGQLKDLANNFATKGKGDDTSVGLLINLEEMAVVKEDWRVKINEADAKRQAEKEEKAKLAKEQREAAEKAEQERLAKEEIKKIVATVLALEQTAKISAQKAKDSLKAAQDFEAAFYEAFNQKKSIKADPFNDHITQTKNAFDSASDAVARAKDAAAEAGEKAKLSTSEVIKSEAEKVEKAVLNAVSYEESAKTSYEEAEKLRTNIKNFIMEAKLKAEAIAKAKAEAEKATDTKKADPLEGGDFITPDGKPVQETEKEAAADNPAAKAAKAADAATKAAKATSKYAEQADAAAQAAKEAVAIAAAKAAKDEEAKAAQAGEEAWKAAMEASQTDDLAKAEEAAKKAETAAKNAKEAEKKAKEAASKAVEAAKNAENS